MQTEITANYLLSMLYGSLDNVEDAMDKELQTRLKTTRRKHDSDDDEDDDVDEGPFSWIKQGRSDPESEHLNNLRCISRMKGMTQIWRNGNGYIPKVSTIRGFKPIPESGEDLLTEPEWTIPQMISRIEHNMGKMHTNKRITFPVGKQASKEDDLEFSARLVIKSEKIALIHIKAKAARYLDFGTLRISSFIVGLRRKEFYINKHSESSDREAVRSQMRILSVISVKVFKKYGYNYLREIILRRADYQEYKISEKDFKNLHPNDFEDLFLLNIQEKLNHLPKTDKTSLHTAVNMWIKKHGISGMILGDLQLGIEEEQNDQRKLMRLNELHKFSDGTLTRVMEKLDHMVKDFHLYEYNKGMETRKWSEDDKRRSKDFITAIEKRLQIRRIYRSLESFVGGRIRDIDYRLINRTT
ncbi:hypothetical protein Tco_0154524 [Tanacetum coccineum]